MKKYFTKMVLVISITLSLFTQNLNAQTPDTSTTQKLLQYILQSCQPFESWQL
jgi:hypothetical protein